MLTFFQDNSTHYTMLISVKGGSALLLKEPFSSKPRISHCTFKFSINLQHLDRFETLCFVFVWVFLFFTFCYVLALCQNNEAHLVAITPSNHLGYDASSFAPLRLGIFSHSLFTDHCKVRQDGWEVRAGRRFEVSPEMPERVQVTALARSLKDIHGVVSRVVLAACLGALTC